VVDRPEFPEGGGQTSAEGAWKAIGGERFGAEMNAQIRLDRVVTIEFDVYRIVRQAPRIQRRAKLTQERPFALGIHSDSDDLDGLHRRAFED